MLYAQDNVEIGPDVVFLGNRDDGLTSTRLSTVSTNLGGSVVENLGTISWKCQLGYYQSGIGDVGVTPGNYRAAPSSFSAVTSSDRISVRTPQKREILTRATSTRVPLAYTVIHRTSKVPFVAGSAGLGTTARALRQPYRCLARTERSFLALWGTTPASAPDASLVSTNRMRHRLPAAPVRQAGTQQPMAAPRGAASNARAATTADRGPRCRYRAQPAGTRISRSRGQCGASTIA